MGTSTSKCSGEANPLYCFNDNVKCQCPNGIPAPGYCTKKKPYRCLKCLPNYGNDDGKTFGGENDITSGSFNEYNNNVLGLSQQETTSHEFKFNKNPNLENNKYSHFPNIPNSNERCDIMESIKLIRKKNRNLEKLKLKCGEILKKKFIQKMLNSANDSSGDVDKVLKESLQDGGMISWTDGDNDLTDTDLYNIFNRNHSEQTNTKNLLKTYTQCSNERLKENNKTIKQLLQTVSYNGAIDNENRVKNEFANKRLLELNVDNKTFYDHLFTFIKHLIYFGLILLGLVWMKDQMLFTVFASLLILLITITIIVITNDIISVIKSYY